MKKKYFYIYFQIVDPPKNAKSKIVDVSTDQGGMVCKLKFV